jgi:hypothetical protein
MKAQDGDMIIGPVVSSPHADTTTYDPSPGEKGTAASVFERGRPIENSGVRQRRVQ